MGLNQPRLIFYINQLILKKTFSLLFASIVLMNAIGFQLFFSVYNFKINTTLDAKIDEGKIADIQTITLKIPIISLPYLPTKAIENDLKGELNYKGNTYRYVKTTIHNDTIYYQCMVNLKGKAIKNAFADYIKKNNNETSNTKKSGQFGQKMAKNYLANPSFSLSDINSINLIKSEYCRYNSSLIAFNIDKPSPPPRHVS
ncbi:MAG: hypothetical protein EAY66_04710 [Sphingobacteriales bacterium]|nr:MAG: hypothetical protein EAY66_04710 [Sphingobacteriales bacterium]